MDFRGATKLFADPDFDGPPEQVYEPTGDDDVVPTDPPTGGDDDTAIVDELPPLPGEDEWPEGGGSEKSNRQKYRVQGVEVRVVNERVQYYDPQSGKLITESLKDYTRRNVREQFASLDLFLQHWHDSGKKQAIIAELEEHGILLDALQEEVGKAYDPFDLILHVAFDQPPLTRRERAENVRKRNYFTRYGEEARRVLEALLDKYADQGIEDIEDMNVLRVQPISRFGSPIEIVRTFGGRRQYTDAIRALERQLYEAA